MSSVPVALRVSADAVAYSRGQGCADRGADGSGDERTDESTDSATDRVDPAPQGAYDVPSGAPKAASSPSMRRIRGEGAVGFGVDGAALPLDPDARRRRRQPTVLSGAARFIQVEQ
jgi:hypothetical protein